jgi:protein-tyrosine phosphatase
MHDLGLPRLRDAARRAGLESLWLPVPDLSEPPSLEAAAAVARQVLTRMAAGGTVVVHCRGGLGRSGTFAAGCLVVAGRTSRDAIRLVRAARPGAVETPGQVRFVERLASDLPR